MTEKSWHSERCTRCGVGFYWSRATPKAVPQAGPIGWVLADVIALPEPVPCRGAQGLWTLPDDVERRVMAQVGD